MYGQSGRYDAPLDATFKPPKGGLGDKYRATRAPNRQRESMAMESDISFGWVDDVDDVRKSRKPAPADIGKSRRGELSNWGGLGVTKRDEPYGFLNQSYDDMDLYRKPPDDNPYSGRPPSGRPPSGRPPPGRPPAGRSMGAGDNRSKPPKGPRQTRNGEPDGQSRSQERLPRDKSTSRDESWTGWRTMALKNPGDGEESWGKMFGQMHLRWSGRQQRANALRPGASTIDDPDEQSVKASPRKSAASTDSYGSHRRPFRQQQNRILIGIIVCVVLIVLAVAIIVPTVILTQSDDDGDDPVPPAFTVYNYNVTANRTYDPAMADPNSDVFIDTSKEFCSGVNDKFGSSDISESYTGCEVTELRNGSVIIVFNLYVQFVSGSTTSAASVTAIITGPTQQGAATFQIGGLTFTVASLVSTGQLPATSAGFRNVKCPRLPTVNNRNIDYTAGTSYKNTATVTCDPGYELQGNSVITCTKTYDWSSNPNCTKITCQNYTIPGNSAIDLSSPIGHKYETNITVTCDSGYDLNGDNIVTCLSNGSWSKSPTCNIKSCPAFTVPDNSAVDPATPAVTYNSSYNVTCNVGYGLSGVTGVTCQADGTWSDVPTCNITVCVDYVLPDNSAIMPSTRTGHTFMTNLTVSCEPGYDIDGSSVVSCMADGTWSTSPACNIKSCPSVTVPAKSTITPDTPTLTYGGFYDVTCDDGYETPDNTTVTCLEDGTWSTLPTCTPIVCEDFPDITNGNTVPLDTSGLQFESTIGITCSEGHQLSSNDPVICQATKDWSLTPTCDPVECVEYTTPSNGQISGDEETTGRTYLDELTVECMTGYTIDGDSMVTCQADSTWSTSPVCDIVECKTYTIPDNAVIAPTEVSGHTYEDVLGIECNDGYDLNGESAVTCMADGTWSDSPSCTPVVCPEFESPNNGMTVPPVTTDLPLGSTIDISCEDGYILVGDSPVECKADKTWSGSATCDPIDCDVFIYPDDSEEKEAGMISNNSTKYNEKISVNCTDGFVLIGPTSFTCNSTGHWPDVTCQQVTCDSSEIVKPNLEVASVVGDVYTMQCEEGYMLVGSETVSCENGAWTDIPDCIIVSCDALESPDNGAVTAMGTDFGDTAELVCDTGFEGSRLFECQADGAWSGVPECTAVTCPDYELSNGVINSDGESPFSYTDELTLSCDDGYEPTDLLTISCGSDGSWTDDTTCEPIECKESVDVANGNVLDTNLKFGETVEVECIEGYELNGPTEINCESDGGLSTKPTCDIVNCIDFAVPANANTVGTVSTTFGSNVSVTCKDGYELEGASWSACQADKSWTQIGTCEAIECDDYDLTGDLQTEDGGTQITGVVYGERATVSCSGGTLLVGDPLIECNSDGTWDVDITCVQTDCDVATFNKPVHSSIISANNTHLSLKCAVGYEFPDQDEVVIECANAAWGQSPACTIVSCKQLPDPEHGMIETAGTTYLQTASLTCDEGYEPEDSADAFVCLATGEWNDTAECVIIDCGDPDLPDNADDFTISGTEFGARSMTVTCVQGFEIDNPVLVTCIASKTWAGVESCDPVRCDEYEAPANSEVTEGSVGETYFGGSITTSCMAGYEFESESNGVVECRSDKTWSEIAVCVKVKCPAFDAPEHGSVVDDSISYQFEDTLEIQCDQGYELTEDGIIICQADKSWSGSPECTIVVCPADPMIENGKLDLEEDVSGREFGDTTDIICNTGYELNDASTIECMANGEWSGIQNCTKVDCEALVLPQNVEDISIPDTLFGAKVTISCENGYELDGEALIECQANGNWSDVPICAAVNCPIIDPPENGGFGAGEVGGGKFSEVRNIICEEGYEIDGPGDITCTANKEWTDVPSCSPVKCEAQDIPDNSEVVEGSLDNSHYGESVTVRCDTGYEFDDGMADDVIVNCQSDKTWEDIPPCVPVACPAIEPPANGVFDAGDISEGQFEDEKGVSCDSGYEIDGPDTIMCTSNKNWTAVPACNPVKCEEFVIPQNSEVTEGSVDDSYYGDSITILCDSGYEFADVSADGVIECQFNTSWAEVPECFKVECPELQLPENGHFVGDATGNEYEDSLEIECSVGYTLSDSGTVTCMADKTWGKVPDCDIVVCEDDPFIENGGIMVEDTMDREFEAEANIICDEGYEVPETSHVRCEANGSWSGVTNCTLVNCSDFTETVDNATVIDITGTTYGETVTVECDEGFILVGVSSIECQQNGSWSLPPFCEEIECIDPGIESGSFSKHNITFYEVTCDEGHVLTGSHYIECTAEGAWDHIPSCNESLCIEYAEDIPGGEITDITGNRYGDTVTFMCDEGYTMNGPDTITCTDQTDWEPTPSCDIVDCSTPTDPENGHFLNDEPTVFDTTWYILCDTGYIIEEGMADSITCLASGNWTDGAPCVEIDCGNITVFGSFASVTYTSGTGYGSVATLECPDGHNVVGENTANCTEIQEWSNFFGCSSIGNVTFESPSYTFKIGEAGVIRCDIQDAQNWTRVMIVDGNSSEIAWVNKTESGTSTGTASDRVEFLDESVFTDNDATVKLEFASIECGDEGVYLCGVSTNPDGSPEDYEQTQISVTSDAEPPTLDVSQPELTYGDEADLSCDGLVGQTDGEPAGTLRLQVKQMTDDDFVTVEEDNVNITDEECNKRAVLQYTFLANSTWDRAEVKCVVEPADGAVLESNVTVIGVTASCGDPPVVISGQLVNITDGGEGDEGQDDVVLGVECNLGFTNLGATNITCTSSGWVGEPNCTFIDCGLPGDLSPMLFDITDETSTTYESIIYGNCSNGHLPEQVFGDDNLIICGGEGEWNSSFSCTPRKCSEFTVPSSASVVFENGTTFGSVVVIECAEGTTLVGNSTTAVCGEFGFWTSHGDGDDFSYPPLCSTVGGLVVGSDSYTPAVGDPLTIGCNLTNTPGWNRFGFFRSPEGGDFSPLAIVDRTGDDEYDQSATGVEILGSSTFSSDAGYLAVRFASVDCDTDGNYFCGAIKGDPEDPSDDNSLTAETRVTLSSVPEEPVLGAIDTELELNEDIELSCEGLVGQDTDTGESLGQINVQIMYSGNDNFESISDDVEPEVNKTGCLVEHRKRVNVTVDSTYNGSVVQCVTVHGDTTLVSNNLTLSVTDTSEAAFEFELTDGRATYTNDMSDPTSDTFQTIESDVCNDLTSKMSASGLGQEYNSCELQDISEGSVILRIILLFIIDANTEAPAVTTVIDILVQTDDSTEPTVQIGLFTFVKTEVTVKSVKTKQGSGSMVMSTSTPVLTIGEPNYLTAAIESSKQWEKLTIYRLNDQAENFFGNVTRLGVSQFASPRASLSDDSVLEETDANIVIDMEIDPDDCAESEELKGVLEFEDGSTLETTTAIKFEFDPKVTLQMPTQIREDRWSLNITCVTTSLTAENRELTWLIKRDGESDFVKYDPKVEVAKDFEFVGTTSSPEGLPCLTNINQRFDMETTVEQWNNTEIMCALDHGTDQEVASQVGTFHIVPKSVCDGIGAGEHVKNPLECRKRVQCNGDSEEWGFIFVTGCGEGTCWVGPEDADCEDIPVPTTTTTTTLAPGTPHIKCEEATVSEESGIVVQYPCELNNIDQVSSISVTKDSAEIYEEADEDNGISGTLSVSDGVTLVIGGNQLNVTVNTTCETEGEYLVDINNGTRAELEFAFVYDPETPVFSPPSVMYVNQKTDFSCTGNVGRTKDGQKRAQLVLETKQQGRADYEEITDGVNYESSEEDCVYTDTASVSVYLGEEFNQSIVRCVAKDEDTVVTASNDHTINLKKAKLFYAERSLFAFIGASFVLECNATGISGLQTVRVVKGDDTLASVGPNGYEAADERVKWLDHGIEGAAGRVKVNVTSSECSDKGDYICEAETSTGEISSTKAKVSMMRKPGVPTLHPSIQIIEDVEPWEQYPTLCFGEVGYPQGSIALETNKDGTFVEAVGSFPINLTYTVDDDTCSTIGNVRFWNKYQTDWDGTDMRCVTRNDEVVEEGEDGIELHVTKAISLIPETFCDDKANGEMVLNPQYCYGQLTCYNNVPLPLKVCDYTECRDFDHGICVPCETVNLCDVGSTPAPTLPPGTPVIKCTKEARSAKNTVARVTCDLTNANITLTALDTDNVQVVSVGGGPSVFDSAVTSKDDDLSTDSEYVYENDKVVVTITSDSIVIDTNLSDCAIAGDYTVRYNGEVVLEDETKLVVTADAGTPEYEQTPDQFYDGQKVTIECQGNIGGPDDEEGSLSLVSKAPGESTWVAQTGGTEDRSSDEAKCGTIVTKKYGVEVTADLNGTTYACETTTADGQTLVSADKVVTVEDPVLSFGDAETVAPIGDQLTVSCSWENSIGWDEAIISRRSTDSADDERVLVYSSGSVVSSVTGISGSFIPGDATSPDTLVMEFDEVKCVDEDDYTCSLIQNEALVAEEDKKISVTSPSGTPVLALPRELVVNENTLYGEPLQCSGDLGYPTESRSLKLEYMAPTTQAGFQDFEAESSSLGTALEPNTETENCTSEVTAKYRSINFGPGWNRTTFRCAIYEDNTLLATSNNQTLQLIENNCSAENDNKYFPHPFDFHLYNWCHSNGTLSVGTCNDRCPVFRDGNTGVACLSCSR